PPYLNPFIKQHKFILKKYSHHKIKMRKNKSGKHMRKNKMVCSSKPPIWPLVYGGSLMKENFYKNNDKTKNNDNKIKNNLILRGPLPLFMKENFYKNKKSHKKKQ
ncbi:hypothetical protein M153_20290002287, partial [Pseudoloma neurophilia]